MDRKAIPSFEFSPCMKPIHWERLRNVNLERVQKKIDISTLLTYLDDVSIGFLGEEEIDENLRKAITLAQLSTQYILSCNDTLKKRKKLIDKAIGTFNEEMDELDDEITRLLAKERALKRECQEYDQVHDQYAELLKELNPVLARKYNRKYTKHNNMTKQYPARVVPSDESIDESVDSQTYRQQKPVSVNQTERRRSRLINSDVYNQPLNDRLSWKTAGKASIETEPNDIDEKQTLLPHQDFTENVQSSSVQAQVSKSIVSVKSIKPKVIVSAQPTSSTPSVFQKSNTDNTKPSAYDNSDNLMGNNNNNNTRPEFIPIVSSTLRKSVITMNSFSDTRQTGATAMSADSLEINATENKNIATNNDIFVSDKTKPITETIPSFIEGTFDEDDTIYLDDNTKPQNLRSLENERETTLEYSNKIESLRDLSDNERKIESSGNRSFIGNNMAALENQFKPSQTTESTSTWNTAVKRVPLIRTTIPKVEVSHPSDKYSNNENLLISQSSLSNSVGSSSTHDKSSDRDKTISPLPETEQRQWKIKEELDDERSMSGHIIFGATTMINPRKSNKLRGRSNYDDDEVLIASTGNTLEEDIPYLGSQSTGEGDVSPLNNYIDSPLNTSGSFDDMSSYSTKRSVTVRKSTIKGVPGESMPDSTTKQHTNEDMNRVSEKSEKNENINLAWTIGRAPLELVEEATALDVNLASLQYKESLSWDDDPIRIQISFAGVTIGTDCDLSNEQTLEDSSSSTLNMLINYAAHLRFDTVTINELKNRAMKDKLILVIDILIGTEKNELIGTGSIDLTVMVDHSCNIIRQDVEILSVHSAFKGRNIGVVVVDVRGHRLMKRLI